MISFMSTAIDFNTESESILNPFFVKELTLALLRVPSGDNCQPFKIKWKPEKLEIYHFNKIAKHALNIDNTSSKISFGCMKKIIEVVSGKHGITYEVIYTDEKAFSDELVAEVYFMRNESHKKIIDAGLIENRFTYRGVNKHLRPHMKQMLEESLSDRFKIYTGSEEIVNSVINNDLTIWRSPRIVRDILGWTNFVFKSDRGFEFRNLYTSLKNWPGMLILKYLPFLAPIFWPVIKSELRKTFSGSDFLVYERELKTADDYILTGEECFEVWLRLTELGISVQPLSISSFGLKTIIDSKKQKGMDTGGEDNLRKNTFEVFNRSPQIAWIFRIGEPLTPKEYSKRIHRSQFIQE